MESFIPSDQISTITYETARDDCSNFNPTTWKVTIETPEPEDIGELTSLAEFVQGDPLLEERMLQILSKLGLYFQDFNPELKVTSDLTHELTHENQYSHMGKGNLWFILSSTEYLINCGLADPSVRNVELMLKTGMELEAMLAETGLLISGETTGTHPYYIASRIFRLLLESYYDSAAPLERILYALHYKDSSCFSHRAHIVLQHLYAEFLLFMPELVEKGVLSDSFYTARATESNPDAFCLEMKRTLLDRMLKFLDAPSLFVQLHKERGTFQRVREINESNLKALQLKILAILHDSPSRQEIGSFGRRLQALYSLVLLANQGHLVTRDEYKNLLK